MKAQSVYNNCGFSTLEVMLAFVVIILSLTAVIGLVFSGQILAVDSQLSAGAINKAQDMLESAKASSSNDFYSMAGYGPLQDGAYQKKLIVQNVDLYIKQVSAQVSWNEDSRSNSIELDTLIVDKSGALGGDTCSQQITGNWKNPQIVNLDLAQISGLAGSYSISSIDAYHGKLYLAVDGTTSKTDPTFFVFNISNPAQPVFISAIDNDPRVQAGIAAIKVAGGYTYAASMSSYSRGQLQIFNLGTNPPQIINTFKLPVINSAGGSKGLGSAIFYRNGLVYLGLTKSDSEKEFNIIDVANPLSPVLKGNYAVGNGINAINVRGGYAYLAHPTSSTSSPQEQLTVLDVSDAVHPLRTGGFYFNGSSGGNGKSLYLFGSNLYFGRTASKISGTTADFIPEFFALDNSSQNNPTSTLGTLALPTPQSLNGLIVRSNLAYFLTTNQFQVWDISNLSNINAWSALIILPGNSTSFDCEGNTFYAGSVDSSGKGYLSIISPGP